MASFTLVKLTSLLVYPLSLSLLLLLVALLLSRSRWTRLRNAILLLATGWLYLSSTAFFANFLMASLERDFVPRAMSVIAPADAIVLLGGALRGDTHMGTLADLNDHADRLVHAAALYRAGKAPVLLLTGGAAEDVRTEAEQMKDILTVMGIPAASMILESGSRNTYDNAVYSAQILKSRGMRRILLVTSAYHMRRSVALFEAQGLEVVPSATDYQILVVSETLPPWLPLVGNLSRTTTALHEIVGYWVYRWQGWM
jgi:uncharacterized SAM-binding protein YcdF (DUF218 family)